MDVIQTLEITFDQPNWDALMDAEKAGDGNYILASSLSINGTVYDSVGVKYKGNSTYNPNQAKNPLHIELDTYKEQDYQGYSDIKLSNGAKDPSFIREVLSYSIIRQYMDAPLSNYANVYINGSLIGLYSNSESISKKFVNSRFGSKSNTFIKCNPIDGAGPQSTDLPDLVYNGPDSSAYDAAYELKSDYGWKDLINFCDTLANASTEIDKLLDVDRALWMLALDNVLVNLDSYIGQFTQNYYLYKDDFNRFLPIIWDLNESLGVFSMTGSGNLNNTSSKQQMSHLLHENDNDFPLIKNLLDNQLYRNMYLAHVKTILQENFEDGSYFNTALDLQVTIDEAFQADPSALFSYNNFASNLENDVMSGGGPMGGNAPGITKLMDGRSDFLLGLTDFNVIKPTISDITLSNNEPQIDDNIFVTANVVEANEVYLGYRNSKYAPFQRVLMFDDGLHGDMVAGDNIYGVEINIDALSIDFYIYGNADDIGTFSPARAEHEYYEIRVGGSLENVVINEFLASNDITQADQDGDFDDWIELYNNSNQDVDLSSYFLTDDVGELDQWSFPENTTISANGYLIVWADDDTDQEGLHANFKLSANGETLVLSNPNLEIVDQLTFPGQLTDISYGRYPNGTGNFTEMQPTFDGENLLTTATKETQNSLTLSASPNPTSDLLFVYADRAITESAVYNLSGQLLQSRSHEMNEITFDFSKFAKGMYILRCSDKIGVQNYIRIAVQ